MEAPEPMPKFTHPPPLVPWDEAILKLEELVGVKQVRDAIHTGLLQPLCRPEAWGVSGHLVCKKALELWPDLRISSDGQMSLDSEITSDDQQRHRPAHPQQLVAAVKERLSAGHRPGDNEPWKTFNDEVRKSCVKKVTDRGYGDKSIKRIVADLDKQDK
jgi:hypothetical protein